jgi:hypothetical protein
VAAARGDISADMWVGVADERELDPNGLEKDALPSTPRPLTTVRGLLG